MFSLCSQALGANIKPLPSSFDEYSFLMNIWFKHAISLLGFAFPVSAMLIPYGSTKYGFLGADITLS